MAVVFTLPTIFGPGFQNGIINGGTLDSSLGSDLNATYSGLTAHSGGGSTSATPMLYAFNHVTTTAANNDSVVLPAAKVGVAVGVFNGGGSTLAIFPQAADKINGGTGGASVTQATLTSGVYYCPLANNWFRISGS